MLDISLLFKIGALSILIIILDKVLKTAGKDELAVMTDLAGIVIVLMMVVSLISKLFENTEKLELIHRLSLVEENIEILKDIESDIKNAKINLDFYYINHAKTLITRLHGNSFDTTDIGKRINEVREVVVEALMVEATEAVVKAEISGLIKDVIIAENLIEEIRDEDRTVLLTRRLEKIKFAIEEKAEADLVAKATGAVVKAEVSCIKSDVYYAEALVINLKTCDSKFDLSTRLNVVSKIISEKDEELAILKATDVIIRAEKSNLQSDVDKANEAKELQRHFYDNIQPSRLMDEYIFIRYRGKENMIICHLAQNGTLKVEPNLCGKDSCNKCKKFNSNKLHGDIENSCYVVRGCSNHKMNMIYIIAYLKDRADHKEETQTQMGFFS